MQGHLRVAMIQGDIPQSLKGKPELLPTNFKTYEDLTYAAAKDHPDLIIWPESAVSFYFQPDATYPPQFLTDLAYRNRLLDLAQKTGTPILFGADAIKFSRTATVRNRAYLISGQGRMVSYYDKMNLVPFAEYLPLKSILKHFMSTLVQSPLDAAPGERQTIFGVGDARICVLICYESIFPSLARSAVTIDANLLVNLTNDAWFGKSSAPYQLLAMTAMRAVENASQSLWWETPASAR